MFLKGFDKFQEKVPMLKGKKIIIMPFYILVIVLVTSYILNQFYSFPDKFSDQLSNPLITSLIPVFGFLSIELLGFVLFSQIWLWRDKLKKKYGQLSYQKIIFVGLTGIAINLTIAFNISLSFWFYSPKFWQIPNYSILVQPFEFFLGNNLDNYVYVLRSILSIFLFLLGVSTAIKTIFVFGFDYTSALYVYFPEKRVLRNNQIYSVTRHPMYNGGIYIALAGFFYTFNLYSLVFCVSFVFCFYIHIHFIEEPELIAQFGEPYREYRHKVPALLLNPIKLPTLVKFLVK